MKKKNFLSMKKNSGMKKIPHIVIFSFVCGIFLQGKIFSQQNSTNEPSKQPLELPEFVITGQERVNVPGGSKQVPKKSRPLSTKELDSLNSLEKKQLFTPSPFSLPQTAARRIPFDGFLRGEFGQYLTPGVEAGYKIDAAGYRIFVNGGYTASGGYMTNTEFSKLFARANASYMAPEKFLFFGGSTTETTLDFNRKSYKLFAKSSAPERATNFFGAGVGVTGNFEGFSYEMGAGWNGLGVTQKENFLAEKNFFDNSLNGLLTLRNRWEEFLIGGDIELDFRTFNGNGYYFTQFAGEAELLKENFSFNLSAGFQGVKNTEQIQRGALYLDAQAEFRLNELFTLRAVGRTGFDRNNFQQFIRLNPYISDSTTIDFAQDVLNTGAFGYFHPNEFLNFSLGARYKMIDRLPVFVSRHSAEFSLAYQHSSIIEAIAEAYWNISRADILSMNITARNSTLRDSSEKIIPYIAPIEASLIYARQWGENFGTNISMSYIGERYADAANKIILSSYIDLRLGAEYNFTRSFSVYARAENLLSANIYIWQGYRERGIFASAGVLWQF